MDKISFIEATTGLKFTVAIITDDKLILINNDLELEYSCDRTESWDVIQHATSNKLPTSDVSIKFDTNYYVLRMTIGNVIADLTPYTQLQIAAPAPYYDVCNPPSRHKSDLEQSLTYDLLGLLYSSYVHRINAYLREQALGKEMAELKKLVTDLSYSIAYLNLLTK
jgi:hypothetical protein